MIDLKTITTGDFDTAEAIRALAHAVTDLARKVKNLEEQVEALQDFETMQRQARKPAAPPN